MSTELITRRGVLRALVLDNQPLWRTTLASMLKRLGMGTIVVCESVAEFAQLVRSVRPHLVVVDPDELPGVTDELARADVLLPRLTIAVVSARRDRRLALDGLRDMAFVTKRRELQEIEAALHELTRARLDWARLTQRELEVLRLVSGGASNRDVARALWLSDQTVKFHLANAYRKLGAPGRREAVERAREAGLLAEENVDDVGREEVTRSSGGLVPA
jgi:DNA-binding NarL/FixJ family response regulator